MRISLTFQGRARATAAALGVVLSAALMSGCAAGPADVPSASPAPDSGPSVTASEAPAESTPAAPAEDATGDFCSQFVARSDAARVDLAASDDLFAWGGRFAAGLGTITAAPPADLSDDFATVVDFYTLVGQTQFPDVQPLADFVEARDVDSARIAVWGACGATPLDPEF